MNLTARLMEAFAVVGELGRWQLIAWAAAATSLALLAVSIRQTMTARQLKLELIALKADDTHEPTTTNIELDQSTVLEGMQLAPIDRVLPRRPAAFIALVVAVAAGLWLAGLALAPDLRRFLTSPEWIFQPFYIAAHFITLRMFINVYTRNFASGVKRLDVQFATAIKEVRLILGPLGALAALVIAIPFCVYDYRYLFTDRYERMGDPGQVLPIDLLMWAIWCLEWFLNALIWVVLIGFLIKNCWTIASYPFRAPIDEVLNEKHYKPFLHMSAQGATIVLAFSICTVVYLYLTGGELTDYLGLAITTVLLIVGFLLPWTLLSSKVAKAVAQEAANLRGQLVRNAVDGGTVAPALEQRLDEVVTMLRLSHLQTLYSSLGQTEAKAILYRLMAPALTIGWQVSQNAKAYMQKLEQLLSVFAGKV